MEWSGMGHNIAPAGYVDHGNGLLVPGERSEVPSNSQQLGAIINEAGEVEIIEPTEGPEGPEGVEGREGPEGPEGKEGKQGKQGEKGESGSTRWAAEPSPEYLRWAIPVSAPQTRRLLYTPNIAVSGVLMMGLHLGSNGSGPTPLPTFGGIAVDNGENGAGPVMPNARGAYLPGIRPTYNIQWKETEAVVAEAENVFHFLALSAPGTLAHTRVVIKEIASPGGKEPSQTVTLPENTLCVLATLFRNNTNAEISRTDTFLAMESFGARSAHLQYANKPAQGNHVFGWTFPEAGGKEAIAIDYLTYG